MADLLDRIVVEVEEEERVRERPTDSGARVLMDEVLSLIADRLGREGAPEWEMAVLLDGVPASVIFEAADRLGVVVSRGAWRVRRRA